MKHNTSHSASRHGFHAALILPFILCLLCAMCTKEDLSDEPEEINGRAFLWHKGAAICFTAAQQNAATKTVYGYAFTDSLGRVWNNKIKWVHGDVLSVYCAQALRSDTLDAVPLADYQVVTESGNAAASAKIQPMEREGDTARLVWGDSIAHVFQALYPVVGTTVNGDCLSMFTRREQGASGFTFRLPEKQVYDTLTCQDGQWVAAPVMAYLPLVAQRTVAPDEAAFLTDMNQVSLSFAPRGTTIEFTITNGYADGAVMKPAYVGVTSTSNALAGKAGIQPDGTWGTPSGVNNSVTMSFPDTLEIASGQSLQFTLFMLGTEDITNLSFYMKDREEDTPKSLQLRYESGEFLRFTIGSKSYVYGLAIPDNAHLQRDGESKSMSAQWRFSPSVEAGSSL